jgi:hypothetical protein
MTGGKFFLKHVIPDDRINSSLSKLHFSVLNDNLFLCNENTKCLENTSNNKFLKTVKSTYVCMRGRMVFKSHTDGEMEKSLEMLG